MAGGRTNSDIPGSRKKVGKFEDAIPYAKERSAYSVHSSNSKNHTKHKSPIVNVT